MEKSQYSIVSLQVQKYMSCFSLRTLIMISYFEKLKIFQFVFVSNEKFSQFSWHHHSRFLLPFFSFYLPELNLVCCLEPCRTNVSFSMTHPVQKLHTRPSSLTFTLCLLKERYCTSEETCNFWQIRLRIGLVHHFDNDGLFKKNGDWFRFSKCNGILH